jgi:hypothetical protein
VAAILRTAGILEDPAAAVGTPGFAAGMAALAGWCGGRR